MSGWQRHLIHLTILRRFSWTSVAYMCTTVAQKNNLFNLGYGEIETSHKCQLFVFQQKQLMIKTFILINTACHAVTEYGF